MNYIYSKDSLISMLRAAFRPFGSLYHGNNDELIYALISWSQMPADRGKTGGEIIALLYSNKLDGDQFATIRFDQAGFRITTPTSGSAISLQKLSTGWILSIELPHESTSRSRYHEIIDAAREYGQCLKGAFVKPLALRELQIQTD